MSPQEIIETLLNLSKKAQSLGNDLRTLSSKTDDVDVVTIITSLQNDAYNLSLDIEGSVDTYKDILDEEREDLENIGDEEDLELDVPDKE